MERALAISGQMLRVGAASAVALCVDVTVYMSLLDRFELAAQAALFGHLSGILVHFGASTLIFLRPELAHIRGPALQAGALAKFLVAGGCGMVATTATIHLAVDRLGLHPLPGKAIAVVLSFLAVFTVLKLLVLQDRRPDHAGNPAPSETAFAKSEA